MHTSAAAHKHDWRTNERRSCSREGLKWIVLVFFGQNNWGKLIDLSEKGMCFQFEQPPSLKEPIEFTFEAMGCMSIPHEANVFGGSFQAAGRVVWTHEFERTAGVQFLDLSQRSREQIRYWLSSETGATEQSAAALKDAVNVGHTAGLTEELKKEWDAEWNADESAEIAEFNTDSPQEFEQEFAAPSPELEAAERQSFWTAEPSVGPQKVEDPAADAEMVRAVRARDSLEQSSFETPPILPQEEWPRRGVTLRPRPQRARVGYVVAVTCLGTLLVAAAVIGIATKFTGKAGGSEVASLVPENRVDTQTEERSAVESAGPFLVEVLDASSRRSVLSFTGDSRQDISTHEVQRPALSAASAISPDPVEQRTPATAKRESLRDFTLAAPHAKSGTSSLTNSSEALVAPTVGEAPMAADAPLGANLSNPAAPVERTLPVGGDVQPARLIRAVLPAYPQIAKSNRVAGDVTLDALIDASGNVRDVSVISGPVFLRDAAKVALKQWKYEPARLDGQPTAMHLTVTVKFKNDKSNP